MLKNPNYREFLTNAPEAYDYDLVTYSVPSPIDGMRLARIRDGYVTQQTDRYKSGMYVAVEVVHIDERQACDWCRMLVDSDDMAHDHGRMLCGSCHDRACTFCGSIEPIGDLIESGEEQHLCRECRRHFEIETEAAYCCAECGDELPDAFQSVAAEMTARRERGEEAPYTFCDRCAANCCTRCGDFVVDGHGFYTTDFGDRVCTACV